MADLVTRLLLNTSNFNNNIQASTKQMMAMRKQADSINSGIRSVTGSIGKMAGVLGIATSATALLGGLKDLVSEGIERARAADGVRHAFEALGRPGLLADLRKATRGTVTDIELMKAAVQANDFRIPVEQLGKYLEFAQLKASQTGQSVDYLTQSIVTGLGRQSLMILDNLGLSAAEIKEQMAGGASMAEAVAKIIDKQLVAAGEHYATAAERAAQKTAELKNEQVRVGEALEPLANDWHNFITSIEIWAMKAVMSLGAMFSEAQRIKNLQGEQFNGAGNYYVNQYKNIGTDQSRSNYRYKLGQRLDEQIQKTKNQIAGARMQRGAGAIDQGMIKKLESQLKAQEQERDRIFSMLDNIDRGRNYKPTPAVATPKGKTKTPKKTGVNYPEGSYGYNEKMISKLEEQMKLSMDPKSMAAIRKQIEDFKAKNQTMEIQAKVILEGGKQKGAGVLDGNGIMEGIKKDVDKNSGDVVSKMAQVAFNMSEPYVEAARKIHSFEISVMEPYQKFAGTAGDIYKGISGIDGMVSSMNSLVSSIEHGASAWEIFMGAVNTAMSVVEGISTVMETANTIMQLTGATATATAAQQTAASGQVVAGKTAEAIAGATAGGAQMPFPYSLIAIALGIAAVMAALSKIAGFATGGTVGGSSFTGDKLLARVNSGERILPAKKAKALDDYFAEGGGNVIIPDVRLRGSDIWLSFVNENTIRSKSGRGLRI